MKRPTVLGIATATPPLAIGQEELFDTFFARIYASVPNARQLFEATKIRQRHFSWDPREAFAGGVPSTASRVACWRDAVLGMAGSTLSALFRDHDRARVGSFVMASCTGYTGPTPELVLAQRFELSRSLRRTFVGHMGCYAAFNAVKIALDSLAARPREHVLVNCSEACTLHIRPESTPEQVVIHALFGDASASLLLANEEAGAGPQILGTHTETLYETSEMMTWEVTDLGFRMTLSPYVPSVLCKRVAAFTDRLLAESGLDRGDIRYWGIHPGGPNVVRAIQKELSLADEQVRFAWEILAEYGNCSSATILLILQRMLEDAKPRPNEHAVLMAFGPGLTMEGLLVRF